jgi:hypothetical protein
MCAQLLIYQRVVQRCEDIQIVFVSMLMMPVKIVIHRCDEAAAIIVWYDALE